MRVIERPAFYILLIKETFWGILPFMVLNLIIFVLFSNLLFVFNKSRQSEYPSDDPSPYTQYTSLYPEESNYSFLSAFKHMWLISLGDFTTDGYGNRGEILEKNIIWLIFLLSTLLIQILFLNMLIAIMSDIFFQVMKEKE